MQPKPSYFALNKLINDEWKTRVCSQSQSDGTVKLRGFRGKYQLMWKDAAGNRAEERSYAELAQPRGATSERRKESFEQGRETQRKWRLCLAAYAC